jgi:hypothetical protein
VEIRRWRRDRKGDNHLRLQKEYDAIYLLVVGAQNMFKDGGGW